MEKELHPLLQAYYTETIPENRKKQLEEYERSTTADTPADQYRRDLFEYRYVDKKRPNQPVDRFLWRFMSLGTIFRTPGFFPKFRRREAISLLTGMHLDDRPLKDPLCEEVLYREYRNGVRRYIATCSDPSYGRKLLGLMVADDHNRRRQCCMDVWGFSYGISSLLGLEKEMALLCRAANDEYCALNPDVESLETEYKKYAK